MTSMEQQLSYYKQFYYMYVYHILVTEMGVEFNEQPEVHMTEQQIKIMTSLTNTEMQGSDGYF